MEKNITFLRTHGGKLVQTGDFTGGSYAYVDMENLGTIVELLSTAE